MSCFFFFLVFSYKSYHTCYFLFIFYLFWVNLRLICFISGMVRYRPIASGIQSSMYPNSAAMGSYLQQPGQFPYPYYSYGYSQINFILIFWKNNCKLMFEVSYISHIFILSHLPLRILSGTPGVSTRRKTCTLW